MLVVLRCREASSEHGAMGAVQMPVSKEGDRNHGLTIPTCPFLETSRSSHRPMPPHTAGIPWNSVPLPVVRQVAVNVVGGEPHTCGRRQKYVYPTLMHHNMPWNSGS